MCTVISLLVLLIASQVSASGKPFLPARTAVAQDAYNAHGWTPMPTETAKLFLKRESEYEASPLCGFANGNASQILSCTSTEYCAFNTVSSAFGCCASVFTSSNTPYYTDCGFYTSCLDSTEACDSNCQADTAIQRCTESAFPRCVQYSYPLGEGYTFTNFGCVDVVASPTEVIGVSDGAEGFEVPEETGSAVLSSETLSSSGTASEEAGSQSSSETAESTRAFTRTQASAGITNQGGVSQPSSSVSASAESTGAAAGLRSESVALASLVGVMLSLSMYALSLGM